ncbi:hypothetical protein D7Y27_29050 [Corallococcus sp. AB004]|uniref:hypothetical protein n=1 Tax=Corallococcus TaxID=83461 RepID=UPI000EA3F1C3|nr:MULTISPECIES: hypothetical protein [Corallococcus]RKI36194.1 hypothetical protein D7Y27_29050 [Corallococcus sp. AB004]NPC72500.1 hypothetical protein [Corallococcus exiguus]NPD23042.1 hypothetical protein [Corallococcus exiguus]NRD44087.1 hypothetical protein [Corallococcus exiguus]RKH99395.1 hypothetical protein D7Y04_20000 [Corallococcus sp. AB038B]
MSRSQPRQANPSIEAETDVVVPAAAASALNALVDAARSQDATWEDADRLIAALGHGPTEEETPRARADLLLELLAPDHPVGDRAGREGVTVRQAAKDALLDLGHPYALALPPELLEREARRRTRIGGFGVAVTLASMLYQTGLFYVVLLHDGVVHNQHSIHLPPEQLTRARVVPWALMTLTGLLPGLVSLAGHALKRRWLQNTGWLLILAQALAWSGLAGFACARSGPSLFTLYAPWHLAWWSAWVTRPLPKSSRKLV